MDHETAIRQIGAMNLMACGARHFVGDDDSLMFQVGSKRGILEKLIIKLIGDLYSVRYVAMNKRDACCVIAEEEINMVHADQLGKIVRELGDRP